MGDNPNLALICTAKKCTITGLEVENNGTVDLAKLSKKKRPQVELYKTASDLAEGKKWGKTKIAEPIAAGSSTELTITVKKGDPPPVDQPIYVVIDPTDKVDELKENNNEGMPIVP